MALEYTEYVGTCPQCEKSDVPRNNDPSWGHDWLCCSLLCGIIFEKSSKRYRKEIERYQELLIENDPTQAKVKYACSRCRVAGVKLWRQYQTMASCVDLMCLPCAEKDQKTRLRSDGDQIGSLVPAIPTGDTFWGYTSVPEEGCAWWNALPPELNADVRDMTKSIYDV